MSTAAALVPPESPGPQTKLGMLKLPFGAPEPVETVGSKIGAVFGSVEGVDAAKIGAMCATDVIYEDLALGTTRGRPEVEAALRSKFPETARLVVERTAGDATTGGFTWHREAIGGVKQGLRGTTYVRLEDGLIKYIREGSEPLVKPGALIEKLLEAVTKDVINNKVPSYTERSPTNASDIVHYLWEEAYPKGAKPDVALKLFTDDILYEDFNYDKPFVGIAQVKAFVEAFDLPDVDFVPLEISGGDDACCFTWKLLVKGNDGPEGISFYATDASNTKVNYIRDIPATKPAPLQQLAAKINPELRVIY